MSGAMISILVPVWNGARHLAETLSSVRRQSVPGADIELVIADDGSTDGSASICEIFADKFLRLSHGGIAKTLNAALLAASGEALMFLDQDDLLLPDAIANLWAYLEDGHRAVSGMAVDFISPEIPAHEASRLLLRGAPYYGLLTGCVLVRRELAREVGMFNEDYAAGQAVDWLMRLGEKTELFKTGIVTARRRIHAGNTSRMLRERQWTDYGDILRKKMERGKNA